MILVMVLYHSGKKQTYEENKVIYLGLKKKVKIKAEYRGLLRQWSFSEWQHDGRLLLYHTFVKTHTGKKTRREF